MRFGLFNVIAMLFLADIFVKLLNDYKARYLGKGKVDPDFKLFYDDLKESEKEN